MKKKIEIELHRTIENKSRYNVFQSYICLWQNFDRVFLFCFFVKDWKQADFLLYILYCEEK